MELNLYMKYMKEDDVWQLLAHSSYTKKNTQSIFVGK